MQYKLDEDTKRIVKAIVQADARRKKRKRSGNYTEFDKKAERAIAAAGEEMELAGYDPAARRQILDKIYESLIYNTPWEMLGETYCCRRLFYEYRKEYCYRVAVHMGIIQPATKDSSQ